MNPFIPVALVAVLTGLGLYAVLARRHAIMVLIGAELLVNAAVLLLVVGDARQSATPGRQALLTGQVGALFAITIAAAEIGLALAIVLLLFRTRGTSDLRAADRLGEFSPNAPPGDLPDDTGDPAGTGPTGVVPGRDEPQPAAVDGGGRP